MADRGDAQTDQIVGRQLRQYICVDIILAEGTLVLLEPQAPQPNCDIHATFPGDTLFLAFRFDRTANRFRARQPGRAQSGLPKAGFQTGRDLLPRVGDAI